MNYENDDVVSKIKEMFEIKCKKCGSCDVGVSFYAGDTLDGGGSTGYLVIECEECSSKFDDH